MFCPVQSRKCCNRRFREAVETGRNIAETRESDDLARNVVGLLSENSYKIFLQYADKPEQRKIAEQVAGEFRCDRL
jgi:hypothetical protein